MLRDFIEIIGIDPISDFPVLSETDRFNQFTIEELVSIPEEKPDVEQITSIMIEATIVDYRVIVTPVGLKVVIDGELNQKIIYTADEPTQSIHSAHFVHPFCTFIDIPLVIPEGSSVLEILQGLGLSLEEVITSPPSVLIEDLSAKLVNKRNIKKCGILFAWVSLNPLIIPFLPVI